MSGILSSFLRKSRFKAVAPYIQGDVLDSEESGLRIVGLIQDAFDVNGAVII